METEEIMEFKDVMNKEWRDPQHGWQEIGKTIEALTISGICTG